MKKWLDKYDDGGEYLGTTNKGFNYNGAWGGPSAQNGLTFLEPTSKKLPKGYVIPYNTPSTELAISVGGEDGEPAYLIPSFKYGRPLQDPISEFKKTGEHLGGPFKTWQEADEWERTVRHPYVEKGQSIPTPFKRWGKDFAMGGSLPGAVGMMYARTQGAAPSNGPYAKKTKASAQDGKEIEYKEIPEITLTGLGEIIYKHSPSSQGYYELSKTATPFTSKRQIKENINAPKSPKDVNFISNYRGALGGIDKYPTSVPFEGEKHWNIDRFIIDPAFGDSYPALESGQSKKQLKLNVLGDMYKYNMLQGQNKDDAFRNAKKFMRQEINPRINNSFFKNVILGNADPYTSSITNFANENPISIKRSRDEFVKENPNNIFFKRYAENPWSETKNRNVIMDYLKDYKKMSSKDARKQYRDWKKEADEEAIRKKEEFKNRKPLTASFSVTEEYKDGGEMQYYQQGLDWKPRNISKNGDMIPKAQPGIAISDNTRVKPIITDKPTNRESVRSTGPFTPKDNRSIFSDSRAKEIINNPYTDFVQGLAVDTFIDQIPYSPIALTAKAFNEGKPLTAISELVKQPLHAFGDVIMNAFQENPSGKDIKTFEEKTVPFVRLAANATFGKPIISQIGKQMIASGERKDSKWYSRNYNLPGLLDAANSYGIDYNTFTKFIEDNWEQSGGNYKKILELANKKFPKKQNGDMIPKAQPGKILPKWQQRLQEEAAKLDSPLSTLNLSKKGYTKDEIKTIQSSAKKEQPVIQSAKTVTNPILEEQQRRRMARVAADKYGMKFNEETGNVEKALDLSPQTDKTLRKAGENIVEPMIDIEGAMGAGSLIKTGLKKGYSSLLRYPIFKDIDRKFVYPIQFRNEIAELKKLHAAAPERFSTGEAAERLKNVLGINPKDIDQPLLTFTPEGSYYYSPGNVINIDLRQAKQLAKESGLTPKGVYGHEYGHFLQREAHRHSEEFAKELMDYQEQLARYNSPENLEMLNDPDVWLLGKNRDKVVFNPGMAPFPRPQSTLIDKYANEVYNVTPTGIDMEPMSRYAFENSDYFTYRDLEQMPHLREMRQSMLDKGYIKDLYEPISEGTIQRFIAENPTDRISSFTNPNNQERIKGLQKIFRNLPAVVPAIGAAATLDKKKKGGKVKKDDMGYWNPENWGEPVEIDSNEITMQGVYEPLIGISDTGDVQYMEPGEDYTFDGETVTEYPIAQSGKTLPTVNVKKEPIYVDDPNDPRLRAYQDSLYLSKAPMEAYNRGQFINKLIDQGNFDKANKLLHQGYIFSGNARKAIDRLTKYNKKELKPIKGIEMGWGLSPIDDIGPVYKKPVQPVQYRKPQPKKEEPVKKTEQPKPVERKVVQEPIVESKKPLPQGYPVYGPSQSLIGMYDEKSRKFYPDYTNKGARAKVNQQDTDLIANEKTLQDYLYTRGYRNFEIEKKKSGGWLDKYN